METDRQKKERDRDRHRDRGTKRERLLKGNIKINTENETKKKKHENTEHLLKPYNFISRKVLSNFLTYRGVFGLCVP